jgi:ligand-binding sensor domain-containing protein
MCWLAATAGGAPAFPLPAYTVRTWSTEDGLPHDSVTAIAQTDDGYFWIGTPGGLARFNGVRFTIFNDSNTPELHDNQIRSLFKDKTGTLWIGHDTGELTRYRDGRFESVHIKPAWKKPMIWHLGGDAENDVWLMNDEGLLFRVRDGLLLTPQAGNALGFYSFERSDDGTMWIGRNGVLSRFQNGRLTSLPFDQPVLEYYVQGICPASDGGFWVASNGRLRKWNGRTWGDDLGACPWGMGETRDGLLAAGTPDQGLFLIQPHGETRCFNRTNGFHDDWVTSLCEDREGNLWVGTGANGLVMLRRSLFTTVVPSDHWRGRPVSSFAAGQDGDLWIGTVGAGLYRYQQGGWTNWGVESGVSNPYLWSILEDARGNVWLGTSGSGLFVQHGNRFEPAPGWENHLVPVMALVPRMAGGLWVGTGTGLASYKDDNISWPTTNAPDPLPDVRAVAEDEHGVVWFGMNGRGLGRLKDGQMRVFRKHDGLASDFVRCLRLDKDGTLWIGTSGGLNRFKQGRFATIGPEQGLPDVVISDIESDGQGHFWISSNQGILRADKTDLDRCADGKLASVPFRLYGKSDGLPTVECSGGFQPAGCRDANGWLYFPTSKGVVTVNPKNVGTNSLPPPVVIEAVRLDDQRMPLPQIGGPAVEIPPGRHRLEFDYAGLSFVAPEKVRYQYRLQGLENKWVNAGTKTSASYSYVPPGSYVFHVIACNNDGVWNETGAMLALTVLPYFWQAWWFRFFAGTAAGTRTHPHRQGHP